MSEIFNHFLTSLNEFKCKLKKLPSFLQSQPEIGHFLTKKVIQIVVLGGVGVGKSSLLERLIEVEGLRLPKGKDSCTRRPVIIRLSESITIETCKMILDVAKVEAEDPFVINLSESELPSETILEFVDLPGITSMSRSGQSSNYPFHTQNLFDSYANAADLILLCHPADVDIVNSDALRRLNDLEIDEEKIIGVLSKLDLLEIPPDGRLKEEIGYVMRSFGSVVAVRNASNLETETTKTIKETNIKEIEFFKGILRFESFGIQKLRTEILRLLQERFSRSRNRIISILTREHANLTHKLKCLSDPNLIINLITNYIEFVNEKVNGDRIGEIYWKLLPDAIESVDLLEGIDRKQLKIIIKNSQGLKSSLQIEDAFKVLVKGQLRISEMIITECLNSVMRELGEVLRLESGDGKDEEEDEEEVDNFDETEEFYDVKSGSISESETSEIEADDYDETDSVNDVTTFSNDKLSQLRIVPGLCKYINKQVNNILESAYTSTRSYLDDYCAMQRELIYCNDEEYIAAFREYYKTKTRIRGCSTLMSGSMELLDVPVRRIISESFDNLKAEDEMSHRKVRGAPPFDDKAGFLKEFLALLFPPIKITKRVEYRPSPIPTSQIPVNNNIPRQFDTSSTSSSRKDEDFLLKLLEIYLKSHHGQLKDFLPKCINYQLIRKISRELPLKLLGGSHFELGKGKDAINGKRIENVIRIIEGICFSEE